MKQKPRSRVNRKKAKTVLRLPDLEHAKAAVLNSLTSALNWPLMTYGGRALVCAMLQAANWSRSSSCWDMSRFKRPSDTLAASSGFSRR